MRWLSWSATWSWWAEVDQSGRVYSLGKQMHLISYMTWPYGNVVSNAYTLRNIRVNRCCTSDSSLNDHAIVKANLPYNCMIIQFKLTFTLAIEECYICTKAIWLADCTWPSYCIHGCSSGDIAWPFYDLHSLPWNVATCLDHGNSRRLWESCGGTEGFLSRLF